VASASNPQPTTAAELAAAADAVERYRARVADLAQTHLGTDREDLVVAIYEAERALRTSQRLLLRAAKVAG
jgi:hypothetical protein